MSDDTLSPQIFADTSNISEIEGLIKLGIIHGITTNPLIVAKEAGLSEPINYYRELVEKFPNLPISIQLLDNDLETLLEQAHDFSSLSPNIVIKVPMFSDGKGLSVLSKLCEEGIKTNVTALITSEQLLLSLLAGKGNGPNYVSLFFNRIKDSGGDPISEIKKSREYINKTGSRARIISGSIRRGQDVFDAALAGSHIITVAPKIIWEMVNHPKSSEFINQAQEAWEKYLSESKKNKRENDKVIKAST